MGVETKIGWTHHTFNPWRGCAKVSAGCARCYADTLSRRNPATLGVWGPNGTRVVAAEAAWREPLKWDRAAREAGERRRVFCASLADVFEDWRGPVVDAKGRRLFNAPDRDGAFAWRPETDVWNCESMGLPPLTMADVRARLFCLIRETPSLTWLLLTKRPENIVRLGFDGHRPDVFGGDDWPNVWLGVSAEDQAAFNARVPILLSIPATVRFVSAEPLLGPIDLAVSPLRDGSGLPWYEGEAPPGLDWIIAGGESGPGRRPMEVGWLASIAAQCRAAGVACYVKQDAAHRDGQQGRIPDDLWSVKAYPEARAR